MLCVVGCVRSNRRYTDDDGKEVQTTNASKHEGSPPVALRVCLCAQNETKETQSKGEMEINTWDLHNVVVYLRTVHPDSECVGPQEHAIHMEKWVVAYIDQYLRWQYDVTDTLVSRLSSSLRFFGCFYCTLLRHLGLFSPTANRAVRW